MLLPHLILLGFSVCNPTQWTEPAVMENGRFVGKLQATCELSLPHSNIQKIKKYFLDKTISNATTVHSGPVQDNRLGMPGFGIDETETTSDGTIRNEIVLASDDSSLFVYSSKSKEIHFSGNAGYLSQLDIEIKIEKTTEDRFKLTLYNLTHIRKPKLAPSAIFYPIAKKQSIPKFEKNLNDLLSALAQFDSML